MAESNNPKLERVLVVSQFYWPEPIGIATYATDLAEWFKEQGATATVVTARPNYPTFDVHDDYRDGLRDNETKNGVRVIRVPTWPPRGGGALRRIAHEIWLLVGILRSLLTRRIGRCNHLVSFCPSIFMVLAGTLLTRAGGSHIAIVHDIQSGLAAGLGMVRIGILARMMRYLEAAVLSRTSRVLVLTEEMRSRLESQGVRTPVDVVPLWVDLNEIFPIPAPEGTSPTAGYSGNLGRKQSLEQILDLAEVLKVKRPDIRVLIRGEGSRREHLEQSATERGLTNVSFHHLVPREQFNSSLAESDIHLVPQHPDGHDSAIPSKIFTLMAAGRAFVCTAEPGSTLDRLRGESQAFVCCPPNNPRAFADVVIRLIDSPMVRAQLGARGRAYVEQHLSRNAILSTLTRVAFAHDSRST